MVIVWRRTGLGHVTYGRGLHRSSSAGELCRGGAVVVRLQQSVTWWCSKSVCDGRWVCVLGEGCVQLAGVVWRRFVAWGGA